MNGFSLHIEPPSYRAINTISPEYISNLLKPMSEAHTLHLRLSSYGLLNVSMERAHRHALTHL